MYLKSFGDGETSITLIPGGPCLPGYLHELRDILSKKFLVSEVDLRDSVLSTKGPPFTIEACFEDIAEALNRRSGKNILLGHSAGAIISLAYAARMKPRIDGLILLNPGPVTDLSQKIFVDKVHSRNKKLNPNYEKDVEKTEIALKESQGEDKSKAFIEQMNVYWPAYFVSGKTPETMSFRKAKPEAIDPIIEDYYQWIASGKYVEGLDNIEVPTLMIHGDYDPIPYEENKNIFEENIPNFKFRLINAAGHFPWYEKPDEVLSEMSNWISSLVGAPERT